MNEKLPKFDSLIELKEWKRKNGWRKVGRKALKVERKRIKREK